MNAAYSISELPEICEIHIFIALYETRKVKTASERLYRSPSSISMRLKQLETKLGRKLFRRTGRMLQPTADGELLVRYSHEILDTVHEAKQAFATSDPAPLLIGSMDSTATARLPSVLQRFCSHNPEIRFVLKTGTSHDMADLVSQCELDVAFVADAHRSYTEALAYRPVFREELVIIAPENHRQINSAEDVQDATVLTFGEGCIYRERLFEWYQASNIEPNVVMDVWSYGAIFSSVAAGMGIAMVPQSIFDQHGNQMPISVHKLDPQIAISVTSMVWPRKRKLTRAISSFLEHADAFTDTSYTNSVKDNCQSF